MALEGNYLNQEDFDNKYGAQFPEKTFYSFLTDQKQLLGQLTPKIYLSWFASFIPATKWIPKYKKSYALPDILAGITLGIMNIPQGMAYGMLAGLNPKHGLYTSFFLPLVYTFFGSSKHVALGTFAVVSLMVREVIDKLSPPELQILNATAVLNVTNKSCEFEFWCGSATDIAPRNLTEALRIAATLSICVGFIQVCLGLLKLGFMAAFLSDQLIQGLTTGASIHVFTSQIKHVFGLNIYKNPAPLGIIKFYGCLFIHILDANIATIITSAVCFACLIITKEFIDPKTRPKLKFPIPMELFVVIGTTLVSWKVDLTTKYSVNIVGEIPAGIQSPETPSLNLWLLKVLPYSFPVAIVVYSIEISLAKLLAKKHDYKIDPNQEWIGVGLAHIFGSFFHCHCGGASMSRSIIQSNQGAKSQVPSLVSSAMLLFVLLWLASLFDELPKCALSCIVIVALKGMYKQIFVLPTLYRKSKFDFMIWLVTFLAVVCLNISLGLAVAVGFALVTTLFRSMWPDKANLAKIADTEVYKEETSYQKSQNIPGIKIFRFDAPLFFVNVENFTNTLYSFTGEDPLLLKKKQHKQEILSKNNSLSQQKLLLTSSKNSFQQSRDTELGKLSEKQNSCNSTSDSKTAQQNSETKCIIVDCSSMPYIDVMGVDTLSRIHQDYKAVGINVYFADCKASLRKMFAQGKLYDTVPQNMVFVSVSGAVKQARYQLFRHKENCDNHSSVFMS